jgi:hypothetical protein
MKAPNREECAFWRPKGVWFASASSAQLKRLFQSGRRWSLGCRTSIVADAADDADGGMGSAFTSGRYRDCPRSQTPLAAEDNLTAKGAKEGLCPAQPASECAGALWPAGPVGAGLQKVGCTSRPLRSVGHELAHVGGHRNRRRHPFCLMTPSVELNFEAYFCIRFRHADQRNCMQGH